jgi:putative ABC transport system permease protein
MKDILYVALKYVFFNRTKTATLVTCITLIAVLPLSLEILLNESEHQLLSRAGTTPLVVGARGSKLDLVMNSLYFDSEIPELISMTASDDVEASDLALPIPIYNRFRAGLFPIIGTILDYFDFRGLEIEEGRPLALLGECVIGSAVAEQSGLKPGDSLTSSPETVFDIAGIYPLKMKVVGILQRSYTADDHAIFVDHKTAWVIEGLGHGHEDVNKTNDATVILNRTESGVVANAKLVQYTEITDTNIDSFHFHGNSNAYPLSAVIVIPHDNRSSTILRGRYIKKQIQEQIIEPLEVVDELLQNIFQIRNILDAVIVIVAMATLFAIILVFALSLRLRQREINTIFKLGCSRLTIVYLVAAEIMVILIFSAILLALLLLTVNYYSSDLVRMFFVR